MFWHYTRRESKVLLNATLIVFAAYAFLIAYSLDSALEREAALEANVISVGAAVDETETNVLMAQLDERARELDAREAALTAQPSPTGTDSRTLLFMALVGAGLLGLILLNFYLDHQRRMSLAG
jgi:hypothetical protein